MRKEKRVGKNATFIVTGRDVIEKEISIQFDKSSHTWIFLSDDSDEDEPELNICVLKTIELIKSEEIFIGSSSELVILLEEKLGVKFSPMILSRKLKENKRLLLENDVLYEYNRTGQKREITLMLNNSFSENDINDVNDTENGSG